MATSASKPGIGQVSSQVVGVTGGGVGGAKATGFSTGHAVQQSAKMTWLRGDTPFHGDGARVQFIAEPGVTQKGWLPVPFRFQYPPLDSLTRNVRFDHQAQMFPGGAVAHERSRPGGRGLRTLPFRTMFTDWDATQFLTGTSYARGVWTPDQLEPVLAVRELEQIVLAGVRFRLKVRSGTMFDHDDLNMLAVITSMDVEEVAGEPDTRYVTLTLQEFAPTELERQQLLGKGPWSHTIVSGDTLYKLARAYYGQQSLWPLIHEANKALSNWAPSRDLLQWATPRHRKRLAIPAKPKSGKYVLSLTGRGVEVG